MTRPKEQARERLRQLGEQLSDFQPWDGNDQQFQAEAAFQKEQQRELEVLDSFRKTRDSLLSELSNAKSSSDLLQIHDRFDRVLSEAERQLDNFRYFNTRLEDAMRGAQRRFIQKMELARDSVNRRENARAADAQARKLQAERDLQQRERIRQTRRETNQILADARRSSSEASSRRHELFMQAMFTDYRCPRCGNNKLLSHTYCHPCSCDVQRSRRW